MTRRKYRDRLWMELGDIHIHGNFDCSAFEWVSILFLFFFASKKEKLILTRLLELLHKRDSKLENLKREIRPKRW